MSPDPRQRPTLSVVSPVHDEGDGVAAFAKQVAAVLDEHGIDFEVLLVDDGSRDDSWQHITDLAAQDPRVHGLRLSRNFGKEAAMIAGLESATGQAVVVMDADLQHPPDLLPQMVAQWRAGADVVEAVKRTRTGQSVLHQVTARGFNRLFSRATGVDLQNASDFRLLSRPAVDALCSLPERVLFFRGTSTWIGFRRTRLEFDVGDVGERTSRWSTRSLLRLALDGLTSFTAAPLHLVTVAAVVFAVFALLLGIQTLVRWAMGDTVPGFTTLLLVLLVQGTFVLMGLGIIGSYLARIHDEVKGRPRYLVAERVHADDAPSPGPHDGTS
ncbi:glycosyltransferase family 2 protein [Egicoccus sp. AB-alg2]|uniref:glycosyltransferase family 2 protein n=1 Tax=Egicoccus sp. AB-alg2 TaxID=3242693 RepID=UPI00359D74F5